MYEKHFGLRETPFSIAPNPRFLYMSDRHREALAHLVYGIGTNGGFVLLTGEVGTGKTTISRCLLEQIPENTNIAVVLNPKVVAHELLATICDELHIQYPDGFNSIKTFVDRIYRYLLQANAAGRRTVVIIEESQNLTSDVLEQLRMLTNLETDQHKLMQIIMIGQPELLDLLALPELRQLEQRVTARYHLEPLSLYETSEYVNHRLKIAGSRDAIFNAANLKKIHKLTGGVPRRINLLCDRVLLGAYVKGVKEIDNGMINRAATEVFGRIEKAQRKSLNNKKLFLWTGVAAALVVSSIGLAAAFYKKNTTTDIAAKESASSVTISESDSPRIAEARSLPAMPTMVTGTLTNTANSSEMSMQAAFTALFRSWGINYDPGMGRDYCDIARTYGLRCMDKSAKFEELKALNRPAVLNLKSHNGDMFYLTMVRVRGNMVDAYINGVLEQITEKELVSMWHGNFTLFWRAPPSYHGPITPGSRGPDVLWLSNQVALIVGRELSKDNNMEYNDYLVEDVKAFQAANGLSADGIVGSNTLIRLNTQVFEDTPLLKQEG